MNKRAIWGISLTAVFAVSMIVSQSAIADEHDGFKTIDEHTITKDKNTVDVTFVTEGMIPTDGSEDAFGYGLITGTNDDGYPENVLALTTHKCVSDSLVQDDASDEDCSPPVAGLLEALGLANNEDHDDETFHAHVLDLKPITEDSDCDDVEDNIGLEVDLARTLQTQNNVSPDYDVGVIDNEITVLNVKIGDLHSAAFNNAASVYFGIVGFADENDVITNLCLTE